MQDIKEIQYPVGVAQLMFHLVLTSVKMNIFQGFR